MRVRRPILLTLLLILVPAGRTSLLSPLTSPLLAAAPASSQPDPGNTVAPGLPAAPALLLLYYGYDANGPRNWTPEHLKYCLAYCENRGTPAEKPVDQFFDTVLWMYRRSSRGALFEASHSYPPTRQLDWQECLDRLFAPGQQLNAMEQTLAALEASLGRPARAWVVLTLPYPDVRVENWSESPQAPTWNFRRGDGDRFEAAKWYIGTALDRWQAAGFKHLDLLGFYWFHESHSNIRKPEEVREPAPQSDVGLIQLVARYLHGQEVDGRPLTLSWIPYSPYGQERRSVVADLLSAPAPKRVDYLMVQPNYFFARWKKQRSDLVNIVRNVASIPCGVEVECDESLLKDEAARQRLRDYLEVIRAEHPGWKKHPVGYYQGLRTVYGMARAPELAPLYDDLYRFVREHRAAQPSRRP